MALGANLVVALAVTYAGPRERDERPDSEVLARDETGPPEEDAAADAEDTGLSGALTGAGR